jgi:hypothetical protein
MLVPIPIFALLCISALLYGLLLVIYRLFFHPLAEFPGLRIVAATKLYEFYKDVLKGAGGSFAFEIEEMHEKYGKLSHLLQLRSRGEIKYKRSQLNQNLQGPLYEFRRMSFTSRLRNGLESYIILLDR